MNNILALTGFAAILGATPAMAQTSGLHLGVIAGYEGVDVESADGTATAEADSTVYGVNAGYDFGLGAAFVGVEGELSTSGASTRFPGTFAGARDGLEANGQYYLGARAGFALTPGISAYGKLGYTALDTTAFTSAGTLGELDDKAGGVRYGGGVLMQLPGPLEGKLEYRRSRYKNLDDPALGDATTNQVVAGVGVRF